MSSATQRRKAAMRSRLKMLFLRIQNEREGPALELIDVDLGDGDRTRRVADDINQSIDCVHAAEQNATFGNGNV